MGTDANIKLWLTRVLVMRWEQRARRVQQSNDRVCQDPLFVESVLIVAGLVIAKKTVVCRRQLKKTIEIEKPEKPTESKVSTCTYCKKVGHIESSCFFKHGRPKKM
jgi:hypothetical protein